MGMREDNKLISYVQSAKHHNCPSYGIEARRIASSLLSCFGSRILSLLHVIVCSQHAIPHPPHSYRRLPETKKNARQKSLHRDA
jgi:hypothetical protein